MTRPGFLLLPFWRKLDALARKRALSITCIGVLAFGGCVAAAAFRGIPAPIIYDEFCYLLAADTYAQGRLTNPPVGFEDFFKTVYVLDAPTYMSKYLPGQGLFLAAGQLAFGHAIFGVWLSVACMAAAICWMLYAWVPPRWALIGGIVAAAQFGIFSYWSNSYWGGAVTALGGALLFGALPRALRSHRLRDALWMGAGIALLLNTRIWEGLVIGLPVGLLFLPWKRRHAIRDWAVFFRKVALPAGAIVLCAVLALAYNNKVITGKPSQFPYMQYEQQSQSVPLFIWQPLKEEVNVREYYIRFLQSNDEFYYFQKRTWTGFIVKSYKDVHWLFDFYFCFPLALGIVLVLLRLRGPYDRRFIAASVLLLLSIAAVAFRVKNHYYASFTCLAVLLIVQGLRILAGMKWGRRRMGLTLVIVLVLVQLWIGISNVRTQEALSQAEMLFGRMKGLSEKFSREEFKGMLLKRGGKHLVLVQYSKEHYFFDEWVYNDGDIEHSPIIWARDLGAQRNMELLRHFKDRQVWVVNVNWYFKDRYFTDAAYPLEKIGAAQLTEGRPNFKGGTVRKTFFANTQ